MDRDVSYPSDYSENTVDIFYPKGEKNEKHPVLFWLYGGGFVAGDKEGVEEFATYLVADTAYTVVSVNYQLAPSSHYPGQLLQFGQAIEYFQDKASVFPMLDFENVMIGGDSAGAQIAAQFVATQTNSTYLSEFNLGQILDPEQIKGAVLYCGPYDLKEVLGQKSDDRFTKFFVNTVGWSLTGQKNWQDSQAIKQASVVDYVTDKFPPTFVTDGNSYSFQEHGLTLVDRLKELNVPVTSLIFNDSDKEVTHKYQFHFTDPLAQKCYDMTKEFTASLF